MAFGLICSITVKVFADPVDDLKKQKTDIENQAKQNSSKKEELQKQTGDLEAQIELLDSQIEKMMQEVDKNNKQIDDVNGQIKQTEDKIAKAEADIKEEQDLFDKRMKVMYVNGNASYLEIILESDGLSDFMSKLESVKKVADYDKKMIADLNDKRSVVVAQKAKLDEENAKLQKLKKSNEDKLSALNTTKANQSKIIEANRKQQQDLDSKNKELNLAAQKKANEILAATTSNNSGGTGNSGRSGGNTNPGKVTSTNAVIQYAMKFLGRPYVWGTRGPDTFDCSGFVQFVYRHFGYEVGYWTGEQRDYGKAVSRSELQPGDMIFFGPSYDGIHHVALYVGDGWYIHAPKTGDVVKLSRLSDRSDYYSARRVIY